MIYTPAQACLILDISTSTLRNYCEVAVHYLSDKATPGVKKHRAFTEDDMRVLMVVKRSRDYEDAITRLEKGERVDIPQGNSEYFLSLDSRDQILLLENRIMQLTGEVEELRSYRDKSLKLEVLLERSEAQLADLQVKFEKLIGENAILKNDKGKGG